MRAEQITDQVAYHGEGPVWSAAWGGLRWVDMLAGAILSLDEHGRVHRRELGGIIAALRPRQGGGAVLGVERGFALEDADGRIAPGSAANLGHPLVHGEGQGVARLWSVEGDPADAVPNLVEKLTCHACGSKLGRGQRRTERQAYGPARHLARA